MATNVTVEEEPASCDLSSFTDLVIRDIHQHLNRHQGRYHDIPKAETLFFQLVQGGNEVMVRHLLLRFKVKGLRAELDWALGTDLEQYRANWPGGALVAAPWQKSLRLVRRSIVFVLVLAVFALLTPAFYALHSLVLGVAGRWPKSPLLSPDLPLIFAVLSECPAMVRLFLSQGMTLQSVDSRGNNVYHYLAELSDEDPDKVKRCHAMLKSLLQEEEYQTLHDVIVNSENEAGLSPLEVLVARGSVAIFRDMTLEPYCLGRVKLAVTTDAVFTHAGNDVFQFTTVNGIDKCSDNAEFPNSRSFSCAVQQQSSLTADKMRTRPRHRAERAPPERAPQPTSFKLTSWEFDVGKYERQDIYGKQSLLLQLIVARNVEAMAASDVTALMTSRVLRGWMRRKRRALLRYVALGHVIHTALTLILLRCMIAEGGDMNAYPLFPKFLRGYVTMVEDIIKGGDQQTEVPGNQGGGGGGTSLRDVFLTVGHGELNTTCVDYQQYFGHFRLTGCMMGVLQRLNETCGGMDSESLLQACGFHSNQYRASLHLNDRTGVYILNTIMWFICFHCVSDFLQRALFVGRILFSRKSIASGLLSLLRTRFPGSYTERILNFLMYSLFLVFYFFYVELYVTNQSMAAAFSSLNETLAHDSATSWEILAQTRDVIIGLDRVELLFPFLSQFLVTCLIIRFILAIHALRLLPQVGFFIITTKKMAKHLMEFALVYGLVTLAFSVIFHFIMRNPDCPAKRVNGYHTLPESFFVTYIVALGHGITEYHHNVNAMVTFVSYTVLSVLLLLNLIIAVMTTTAEELNNEPWKSALCRVELWDEILGAEAVLLTLLTPVKVVADCFRRQLSKAVTTPAWACRLRRGSNGGKLTVVITSGVSGGSSSHRPSETGS